MTIAAKPRTAELAATLRGAVMRLNRRLRRERPDVGLTVSQMSALGAIDVAGPLTPRELADAEHVQPPSMTRTVAALEERGLVVRAAHPRDGRQVLLSVSPAGAALLTESRRVREAWLAGRLDALTPEERATLTAAAAILERIARS